MSKIIPNIKERVLLIAENQEDNKQMFFRKVGLKYSNFTGKSKESDLSSSAVADILLIYPEINPIWLLTGKESMFIEKKKINDDTLDVHIANTDRFEDIIARKVLDLISPRFEELKNIFSNSNDTLELLKLREYIDLKIKQLENIEKSSVK